MIDSYLSIQHIYAYQNKNYYRMNIEDKTWTNLQWSYEYNGDNAIMTVCEDGSLLLTPNPSTGTAAGMFIHKIFNNTENVLTTMREDRAAYGIVEQDNQFWMIGGNMLVHFPHYTEYRPTSTILHWNSTNHWSSGANMTVARSSTAASVLFNGKIYVFGANFSIQTCECYDIHQDKWNPLQPMPSLRWSHRAVVYDEVRPSILVMGGYSTIDPFVYDDIFLYDITLDSWSIPKWKLPIGLAVSENDFYVYMCYHLTQLIVISHEKPFGCWIRDVTNDLNDWIVLSTPGK